MVCKGLLNEKAFESQNCTVEFSLNSDTERLGLTQVRDSSSPRSRRRPNRVRDKGPIPFLL